MDMEFVRKNEGITLIALVVTIIVLLILTGVTISMLTGENGIITKAFQAKMKSELAEYKEQINLFIIQKKMENQKFNEESLFVGQDSLRYNTKNPNEKGNIKAICPNISDNWIKKFEVIKGKIVINTQNKNEIKVAQSIDLDVNPYEITEEGELVASSGNLLLIDSSGTLVLPDSVKTIGEGTFANTESDGIKLKKVIIPASVTEIKANAFYGNSSIEEVEILEENGKGVTTIGNYAFASCKNLKKIVLPNTVTSIGVDLFIDCSSLQDVKLSNSLKEIGYEMFYRCYALSEITIPEGVLKLSAGAFGGCGNLNKLSLPSSLNEISSNVFTNCYILDQIELLNNSNFIFEDGILMDNQKTDMKYISPKAKNVETFVVPNTVTNLGANLLISSSAKKVIIPASVATISIDFFPSSIENIEIDSNNSYFMTYNGAIYNKDKTILYYYFSKDTNITLADTTVTIGIKAFLHTKATNVVLPDSVTTLNSYSIYSSKIKYLKIGKNVSTISTTAFGSCDLNLEIDPENINYTQENGILYNKEKTQVISCFKNLEEVNIPKGVTGIWSNAFRSRTSLKNVTLPSTLQKIDVDVFTGCSSLTEIEIPSSVTSMEQCFTSTTNLKKIIINKEKDSISGEPWGCPFGARAIEWRG